LTIDADSAAIAGLILGEEAHIIAKSADGPRGSVENRSSIDSYANLILLCGNDHKRVDKQPGVYTADSLRKAKADHARWAADRFTENQVPEPIQVVKAEGEDEIPVLPVTTGRQL
jgi:hypothetical protein